MQNSLQLRIFVARRNDLQGNQLISLPVAVFDALAFQAQFVAAAGIGRNFDRDLAVDGGYGNFGAQNRFFDGDRQFHGNILPFQPEIRVFVDV